MKLTELQLEQVRNQIRRVKKSGIHVAQRRDVQVAARLKPLEIRQRHVRRAYARVRKQ